MGLSEELSNEQIDQCAQQRAGGQCEKPCHDCNKNDRGPQAWLPIVCSLVVAGSRLLHWLQKIILPPSITRSCPCGPLMVPPTVGGRRGQDPPCPSRKRTRHSFTRARRRKSLQTPQWAGRQLRLCALMVQS